MEIEMCRFYTTSGHSDFKPRCTAGDSLHKLTPRPGLKCHSRRMDCLLYQPSDVPNGNCPLCEGTKEVINRPERLMGATYMEDDLYKGDEHIEPCPLCRDESSVSDG